jgi:hypothetical protein
MGVRGITTDVVLGGVVASEVVLSEMVLEGRLNQEKEER